MIFERKISQITLYFNFQANQFEYFVRHIYLANVMLYVAN